MWLSSDSETCDASDLLANGCVEKISPSPKKSSRITYYEDVNGCVVAQFCSKCKRLKKAEFFIKDGNNKRGLRSSCKWCMSDRRRKYYAQHRTNEIANSARWRKENPEKVIASNRQYREDNVEKRRNYGEIWRQKNPDYHLVYQEKHRERYRELSRNWKRNNGAKSSLSNLNRRARIKELPYTLIFEEMVEIANHFKGGCALTASKEFHWDHVIPISTGHGGTTFSNMIPLRGDLNISKSDNNLFDWFEASRQRFKIPKENFDRLIKWLGKANGMTVEEYRNYVNWCHENPNEINSDEGEAI